MMMKSSNLPAYLAVLTQWRRYAEQKSRVDEGRDLGSRGDPSTASCLFHRMKLQQTPQNA